MVIYHDHGIIRKKNLQQNNSKQMRLGATYKNSGYNAPKTQCMVSWAYMNGDFYGING